MKANNIQNIKIRKNYQAFEFVKKTNKFLLRQILNSSSNYEQKRCLYMITKYLNNQIPSNSSKSQIKNQCVMTGRNRSINKKYSLSRMSFRNLLSYGVIPGYKKSAW